MRESPALLEEKSCHLLRTQGTHEAHGRELNAAHEALSKHCMATREQRGFGVTSEGHKICHVSLKEELGLSLQGT